MTSSFSWSLANIILIELSTFEEINKKKRKFISKTIESFPFELLKQVLNGSSHEKSDYSYLSIKVVFLFTLYT